MSQEFSQITLPPLPFGPHRITVEGKRTMKPWIAVSYRSGGAIVQVELSPEDALRWAKALTEAVSYANS